MVFRTAKQYYNTGLPRLSNKSERNNIEPVAARFKINTIKCTNYCLALNNAHGYTFSGKLDIILSVYFSCNVCISVSRQDIYKFMANSVKFTAYYKL